MALQWWRRFRYPGRQVTSYRIEPESPVPPFEQLRQQLLARIHSGELAAGAKLPTVRQLAQELGLAPNTVARCYRELEHDSILETRGRNGTFVAWSTDAAEREAQEAAQRFADLVRTSGIDPGRALDLVRQALGAGQ